jgi:archaellum component FlaC
MSKDLTQNPNGSLEDKINRLIALTESVDSHIGSLETHVDERLRSMDSRLGALETKVEERLKDTRPMWEAVQAQLAEVESSLRSEIRSEVQGLRAEMEKGFRMFDRRLEYYSGEVTRLYAYERDLEDRVEKIEKGLNQ